MKKYLLETSVIVSYLRGKDKTINLIENLDGEFSSSFVCLAELYEGINRSRDKTSAEEGVLNFFAGLSEIFGVDQEVARSFGRIRAHLKRKGRVIEDMDIFIAATCVVFDLTLVTYNPKHFKRIKELEVLEIS